MNPALDFLLKKKGPIPLVPFFRILKGVAELATELNEAAMAGEFILEGGGSTTADALTGTDFYSPAIQKYESSALGSSRII